MTDINRESVREAYDDVRNDATETNWVTLAYEGNMIDVQQAGTEYAEFKSNFTDDARVYGFVRIFTGDEMSKRAKFALVTWSGKNVSALKRAKMSTDKSVVKSVIQSFACEINIDEEEELEEENIKQALIKAGGANYGTGQA